MRNALTNVVGARARTEVHVAEQALADGDMILLSSDGVHGVLDERRLERLLLEGDDPTEMARNLISSAAAQRQPRQLHGHRRAVPEIAEGHQRPATSGQPRP